MTTKRRPFVIKADVTEQTGERRVLEVEILSVRPTRAERRFKKNRAHHKAVLEAQGSTVHDIRLERA